MKHPQFMLMSLVLLLTSCSIQTTTIPMHSLESKNNETVNYIPVDFSIQMDAEHPLIRLAEYCTDTQGNPHSKTKLQLRYHDPLFLPYQVEKDNVPVDKNYTVALSDVLDPNQVHPEAIGFQLVFYTNFGTVTTSVFDEDLKKALTQNTLKVRAISEQTLGLLDQQSSATSQKQLYTSVGVFAREILPAEQGQTFSDITLTDKPILDFNIAYAPFPEKTDNPIPLKFAVILTSNSFEKILYMDELDTNHPDLLDLKQGWVNHTIDLSGYSGQQVSIRFETWMDTTHISTKEANNLTQGLWGSPIIYTPRSALPQPKPNVIFISLDTLRADHLGSYGYERDTSPNIDVFAKEALLFEKCIATSSWTLPTHASIFTGLQPAIHGAYGIEKWRLSTSYDTLAEVLHEENYTTVAFTDGGVIAGEKGFYQGFDLFSDGVSFQNPRPAETAKLVVDQTLNWLDVHQDAPFFLFMHTFEIHDVYQPPEPFLGMFGPPDPAVIYPAKRGNMKGNMPSKENAHLAIARYDEGIAYTDNELGRLFTYLKENGLTDNTIIVLFADHGEEFYDHNEITHRHNLYNETVHVPLIIRMPGSTPPTGRINSVVSQLDLFNTVMEALQIDYSPPSTSHSLMPLINNDANPETYTRTYAPSHLLIRKKFFSDANNEDGLIGKMLLSVENAHYKYILSTDVREPDSSLQEAWDTYGKARDASMERQILNADPSKAGISEELYFLIDDVHEQNNRAEEHLQIKKNMRQLLRDSLDEAQKTVTINAEDEAEEIPLTDDERAALEALGYL